MQKRYVVIGVGDKELTMLFASKHANNGCTVML